MTWVRGDKLVRAVRLGCCRDPAAASGCRVRGLPSGPRPLEQKRGLTTLLPPDLVVKGDVKRGRVVVDLEVGAGLEPTGLPLAVGQVAITALAVPRIRSVVFTLDGTPTAVPVPSTRGTGRDTARVVRASDYRTVLAR